METGEFSIEEYLRKNTKFQDHEIIDRKEGENNQNFIYKTGGEKYVARKTKEISSDENTLENERNVLKFLKSEGLDIAPRSVNYDEDNGVQIVSFVGEQKVKLNELEEDELRRWTKRLAEVNKLTFDRFSSFCDKQGYPYETPQKGDFIRELLSRLEDLDEEKYGDLVKYSRIKLEELQDRTRPGKLNQGFLAHSDLANSTRRTGKTFYIIDWEYSGFKFSPVADLGILYTNTSLGEKSKSIINDEFKKNVDVRNFDKHLEYNEELRQVFSIIWSLERFEKSPKEKYLEYAKYHKENLSVNSMN